MIVTGNILEPDDIVKVEARPGLVILTLRLNPPNASQRGFDAIALTSEAASKLLNGLKGEA